MILFDRVSIRNGHFHLDEITLEIPSGAYGILMGKTGSGKTTLLEAVAGLKAILSGRIVLNGHDVTRLKPAQRHIGYVPQDGALFPTMTVREHLEFALVIRRAGRQMMDRRVAELAQLLGIDSLLDRGIAGLSGGEKQRVALGRALAFYPSTLLLDEPLSALDDGTREQMYSLLKRVREETHVTTLHVTHNEDEALRLADQLFRLEGSHVKRQAATHRAGYDGRSADLQ